MQRNSFLGIAWFLGFALPAAGAAAQTPDDADKLAGSEAAWKATTVPVPASAWDWPGWLLGRGDRGPAFEAEARNLLGSDEDLAARTERYRLITSPFGVTSGPSLDPACPGTARTSSDISTRIRRTASVIPGHGARLRA